MRLSVRLDRRLVGLDGFAALEHPLSGVRRPPQGERKSVELWDSVVFTAVARMRAVTPPPAEPRRHVKLGTGQTELAHPSRYRPAECCTVPIRLHRVSLAARVALSLDTLLSRTAGPYIYVATPRPPHPQTRHRKNGRRRQQVGSPRGSVDNARGHPPQSVPVRSASGGRRRFLRQWASRRMRWLPNPSPNGPCGQPLDLQDRTARRTRQRGTRPRTPGLNDWSSGRRRLLSQRSWLVTPYDEYAGCFPCSIWLGVKSHGGVCHG